MSYSLCGLRIKILINKHMLADYTLPSSSVLCSKAHHVTFYRKTLKALTEHLCICHLFSLLAAYSFCLEMNESWKNLQEANYS